MSNYGSQPPSLPTSGSRARVPLQTAHITPPQMPNFGQQLGQTQKTPTVTPPQLGHPHAPQAGTFVSQMIGSVASEALQTEASRDLRGKATASIVGILAHLAGVVLTVLGVRWAADSIHPIRSLLYAEPVVDFLWVVTAILGSIMLLVALVVSIVAAVRKQKLIITITNILLLVVATPLWGTAILADGGQRVYSNSQSDALEIAKNVSYGDAYQVYSTLASWGLVDSEEEFKEKYGIDLKALEEQVESAGLGIADVLSEGALQSFSKIVALQLGEVAGLDGAELNEVINVEELKLLLADSEFRKLLEDGDVTTASQHPGFLKLLSKVFANKN